MKQRVKSAPKELVRRGLDDGTERLRGQLRDTAQRGQADDYGGDRIEDAAVGGARRTVRGAEALTKKRAKGKGRIPEGELPPPTDPPAPQDLPAEPPPQEPPAETSPQEPPRIKTREAVVAKDGGNLSADGGRTDTTPATESERQRIKIRDGDTPADTPLTPQNRAQPSRIKMREPAVYDPSVGGEPVPEAGAQYPKIRTKDVVVGAPSDYAVVTTPPREERPSAGLSIKTKDAYIQQHPTAAPDQPSQAFVQGQRGFMRKQSQRAAVKRTEVQRTGNSVVPQVKGDADAAPSVSPVPARHGYTSAGRGEASIRLTYQPSLGGLDVQPMRKNGKTAIKTAQSVKKAPERTARHAIKTAERSSGKAIKVTQRTAKTTAQTTKTAEQTARATQQATKATVKATQRAVQTVRATTRATATTAKTAVKAAKAAIKAAIAALHALTAAIAAGGWVAVVIVLVLCLVGLLIASPFGIFFAGGGGSPDAVSPSAAVAQISREYNDTLSELQEESGCDSVEIVGQHPAWGDVFAVFAVKTVVGDGVDVVVWDEDRVERLRIVFWDMTKITTETRTVDHPATDDEDAWTETVLVITITPRTPDDMRVFYVFTEEQNAILDELLAADNDTLWSSFLYGSSDEIVAVALSQLGNVGGRPYWSWYGFSSRVSWCACFVSWCANECGYIDAGIIPKFASCAAGANWFKNRDQWQNNRYEPRLGDIIFFDWDNKGSSGPQDNWPDHVGIVERVENGVIYTVEGNSSDSCRQRSYNVGHYEIWGYGTPIYN